MSKILTACFLFALAGLGAQEEGEEPTLKLGDKAPPLKVSKWVKGGPVDLSEGLGKQIYVVEFWATWCGPCRATIPHLTKLARRFGKSGVTIIGISIDGERTRDKVEPFVKDMGDKMDYAVAMDDSASTQKAYLEAAGANGIPHAFIVGKDGKIAWQGHPQGGLDLRLAEMVGDKEYAEAARKEKDLQEKLSSAAEEENWAEALKAIEGLLELDPQDPQRMYIKFRLLVLKKDGPAASKWGQEIVGKIQDTNILNGLSWGILTDDEFEGMRDLPLALAAAKKANDLTGGANWSILDTYARALFETKSFEEAIRLQRKAIEIAKKEEADESEVEDLQGSLVRYMMEAPPPGAAGGPAAEPGFTSLFDGKDIARHWDIQGNPESWKVVDGIIRSTPGGDRIVSKEKYGDFVLRLDWKVSEKGNSGVFIRVPSPGDGAPWVTGFEVQISNEGRDDSHCTGSLYGVAAVSPRPDETPGVWHSFEIKCLGSRISVKSDGVPCVDADAEKVPEMKKRPLEGFIGLQDSHSGPGSTIEYRNIRIQRLLPDGTVPGFTFLTKDGKGWRKIKTGHGTGGRWTFEDGAWAGEQDPPGSGNGGINVTEAEFGDFEFILEAKPAWGGDSGIFLRSTEDGRSYQVLMDYYEGGSVGGIYGEGIGGFSQINYRLRPDKSIERRDGTPFPFPIDPSEWKRLWDPNGYNDIRGRIAGNPPTIDVWLNGTRITHFEDKEKRLGDRGRFGLQVHGGDRWPKGDQVRYRKIQIRPLEK